MKLLLFKYFIGVPTTRNATHGVNIVGGSGVGSRLLAISLHIRWTRTRRPPMRLRSSGSPTHCDKKCVTFIIDTHSFIARTCRNVRPSSRNNLKGTSVSIGFRRSIHPPSVRNLAPDTAHNGVWMPAIKRDTFVNNLISSRGRKTQY